MNQEQIKFLLIIGTTVLVWGGVFLSMFTVLEGLKSWIKEKLKKKVAKSSKELQKESEEHNERLRRSRLIDGKEFLSFDVIPRTHYRAEIKCNNCSFYQEFSVSKGTTQEDFKKTVDCMRCDVKLDYKI